MPKKNQSNPKPEEHFREGFILNPHGNLLIFHQTQICLVLFLILMREIYWFKLFGIYWVESTCGKIRIISSVHIPATNNHVWFLYAGNC